MLEYLSEVSGKSVKPCRDIIFYEAFEEEADELRHFMPEGIDAGFHRRHHPGGRVDAPPARVISTRTQSRIPPEWLSRIDAILTRSTGYDHLLWIRGSKTPDLPLGHLPLYCARAVAEQAMMFWTALFRRLPAQQKAFRTVFTAMD